MPPVFNEKCTACFKCVEICPGDVLMEGNGKPVVAYPDECWHCGACMMDCPSEAVRLNLPLWKKPIKHFIRELVFKLCNSCSNIAFNDYPVDTLRIIPKLI